MPNPDQRDSDGDNVGDVCDPDADGDGLGDACDDETTATATGTPTRRPRARSCWTRQHAGALRRRGQRRRYRLDEAPANSGRATPDPLCAAGADTDGDAIPNAADTDDDNDGFSDARERSMSTDALGNCRSVSGHDA